MVVIDIGLAITIAGVLISLAAIYNGRKTRQLIQVESRLTRELIAQLGAILQRMDSKLDILLNRTAKL